MSTSGRLFGIKNLRITDLYHTEFNLTLQKEFKLDNILVLFKSEKYHKPALMIFLLMGKICHVFANIDSIENKDILNIQTDIEQIDDVQFLLEKTKYCHKIVELHWLKENISIIFMSKSEVDKLNNLPDEELLKQLWKNNN